MDLCGCSESYDSEEVCNFGWTFLLSGAKGLKYFNILHELCVTADAANADHVDKWPKLVTKLQ